MTDNEKLAMLKADLQMNTSSNDPLLSHLLEQSKQEMITEGIIDDESFSFESLQIQYAAYLFRKRAAKETAMPRFLRYGLNNLLFHQKGEADDV